jgi:hypothetical protein
MRRVAALLGAALLGGLGCPAMVLDPLGRDEALRMTQREYTNRIRWGDIERAAEMVDPELREDFLGFLPAFEQIRITDFEIGKFAPLEDGNVNVPVTYRGYSLATLVEHEIRETQEWYRVGRGRTWRVRPEIAGIANAFHQASR